MGGNWAEALESNPSEENDPSPGYEGSEEYAQVGGNLGLEVREARVGVKWEANLVGGELKDTELTAK